MSPWERFASRLIGERPILRRPIRLVCFDLDGVLLHQESSWVTVHKHFGVQNEESLHAFLRGEIDDEEFIRRDVALWRVSKPDLTLAEIEEILERGATTTEGASETIDRLHAAGIETAIVSGGIDVVARATARRLGIPRVSANALVKDAEGRLTGEGVVHTPLGDKARVVRRFAQELGLDLGQVASVGNFSPDISMFRASGLAIAFRPTDEFVQRAADVVLRGPRLTQVLETVLSPS